MIPRADEMGITEPASVTDSHASKRNTRAKKEARRARTETARTTHDRLDRHYDTHYQPET